MKFILILSFALMSSLNYWVKSEEFCQAFKENNHRISYTYNYNDYGSGLSIIELIIKDNYWSLKTNEKVDYFEFKDPNRESGPKSSFFSADYSLALTACNENMKSCSVLLINTNTWMASIGTPSIEDHMNTENLKQKGNPKKIKGITGEPFAAIQTFDFGANRVFVEYNRTTGQLVPKRYDVFSLDGNEIKAVANLTKSWPFLNSSMGSMDLFSVISHDKKGSNYDGYGFFILFGKDAQVRWCWNSAYLTVSEECKTGKLLVDCSTVSLPTMRSDTTLSSDSTPKPDSEPKPEDTETKWLLIAIIGVSIVFIVLIVVAIICCFRTKKSKAEIVPQSSRTAATRRSEIQTSEGLSKAFAAGPEK